MAIANEHEIWQQVGTFVHRFELAWKEGKSPPAIEDYLPEGNSIRLDTLIELAHVDLERRLTANLPASAEDYLNRYPELAADPQVARDLIVAEQALRRGEEKPTRPTDGRVTARPSRPEPNSGKQAPAARTPPFVLGAYQIEAKIGKGGMGEVYRAVHAHLQKQVAIKILPPDLMADPQAVARFRREWVAIGRLDHPNIVRATDAGEVNGEHFLAMDFIEGTDLAKLLQLHSHFSLAEACSLVYQTAKGLQYAHENKLVHRDIKPSNLLLSAKGELKILDFGLALLQHCEGSSSSITARGQPMGTVDYMAPEQCQSGHDVDIRADIYSLGCTLYTLLVGQPPFSGPGYDTPPRKMNAHQNEPVKSVMDQRPDVPLAVEKFLQRMVAKNPADRPATPAEVVAALEPFCQGAALAQVAGQCIAGRDSGALENVDQPLTLGNTITGCEGSTDGQSNLPPTITDKKQRRVRGTLALAGFLGFSALVLFAIIQPWSWTGDVPAVVDREIPKIPPEQKKSPSEPLPKIFLPGQKYNLLDHSPTELAWTQLGEGSHWGYEKAQKLVWANCLNRGVLRLGIINPPILRYDLNIEVSQNPWAGGIGIFFRGREVQGGNVIKAEAILIQHFQGKKAPTLGLELLHINKKDKQTYLEWGPNDSTPYPKPGKNWLRITVGSKGLEKVFWNDVAIAPRLCAMAQEFSPRTGAEGSLGIYLENGNAIIHSATLSIRGDNP